MLFVLFCVVVVILGDALFRMSSNVSGKICRFFFAILFDVLFLGNWREVLISRSKAFDIMILTAPCEYIILSYLMLSMFIFFHIYAALASDQKQLTISSRLSIIPKFHHTPTHSWLLCSRGRTIFSVLLTTERYTHKNPCYTRYNFSLGSYPHRELGMSSRSLYVWETAIDIHSEPDINILSFPERQS